MTIDRPTTDTGDAPATAETPGVPDTIPDEYEHSWKTGGGDEFKVTQKDLRDGYMRHGDYTQKTERLARDTEALTQKEAKVQELMKAQAALDADPARAARFKELWGKSETPATSATGDTSYDDPDMQKLTAHYDAQIAQLKQETQNAIGQLMGNQQIADGMKQAQEAAGELGLEWNDEMATAVLTDLHKLPLETAAGAPDMVGLLKARYFDNILAAEREKAKAEYAKGKAAEEGGRAPGAGLGAASPPPPGKKTPTTRAEAQEGFLETLHEASQKL